jgi:hypothetical protein
MRFAAPLFMCAGLADKMEQLGQQEKVARQLPVSHVKLRLLYSDLFTKMTQMHGQLRLRFGDRHGTIELPEVDGSVRIVVPRADGEGAAMSTACVVCLEEPYSHAFWPCGPCVRRRQSTARKSIVYNYLAWSSCKVQARAACIYR